MGVDEDYYAGTQTRDQVNGHHFPTRAAAQEFLRNRRGYGRPSVSSIGVSFSRRLPDLRLEAPREWNVLVAAERLGDEATGNAPPFPAIVLPQVQASVFLEEGIIYFVDVFVEGTVGADVPFGERSDTHFGTRPFDTRAEALRFMRSVDGNGGVEVDGRAGRVAWAVTSHITVKYDLGNQILFRVDDLRTEISPEYPVPVSLRMRAIHARDVDRYDTSSLSPVQRAAARAIAAIIVAPSDNGPSAWAGKRRLLGRAELVQADLEGEPGGDPAETVAAMQSLLEARRDPETRDFIITCATSLSDAERTSHAREIAKVDAELARSIEPHGDEGLWPGSGTTR